MKEKQQKGGVIGTRMRAGRGGRRIDEAAEPTPWRDTRAMF